MKVYKLIDKGLNIIDSKNLIKKHKGFFASTVLEFAEKKVIGVNYSVDKATGLYIPTQNLMAFLKDKRGIL